MESWMNGRMNGCTDLLFSYTYIHKYIHILTNMCTRTVLMCKYTCFNAVPFFYIPVHKNMSVLSFTHLTNSYTPTNIYLAFFTVLAVIDVSLFCRSRDLIDSYVNPTPFCITSGKVYAWSWICYVCFII